MLSRRSVIKNFCVSSALSGLPIGTLFASSPARPAVGIVDRLLPGANEIAAPFEHQPASVHWFSGDPGRIWLQTIEPLLRAKPVAIAGYTSASTLFCLHYLGRDYGLSLSVHRIDGVEVDSVTGRPSDLLDLRDPRYRDPSAAHRWLLAPQRG